jgi:hypothetical protein
MPAGEVVRTTIALLLGSVVRRKRNSPRPKQNSSHAGLTLGRRSTRLHVQAVMDGKYRYGFRTADFGIVLAFDSQELQKAPRPGGVRGAAHHALLQQGFRWRSAGQITVEFVKHYHDVHPALDPDSLATQQQSDADALAQETEREIRKHPEKKAEKEILLAARQKDGCGEDRVSENP